MISSAEVLFERDVAGPMRDFADPSQGMAARVLGALRAGKRRPPDRRGQLVRAGGTLMVCRGDACAEQGAERIHVATMLATMVRRRSC